MSYAHLTSPQYQREVHMRSVLAALSLVLFTVCAAQAQTGNAGSGGFEKKNYNYSEWTKGLFSEVVTVTHPGKMIFLAGVGAEDENGQRGAIRHLGDFAGQCQYAYDKIKRLLAAQSATMNDVVKIVTYVTDIRNLPEAGKCRSEALAGAPQPVHTFLNINQLAWPGMLVEVDVIAITKEP
jgi:2-iminobutanoate/2-iminopropanoate deaminase